MSWAFRLARSRIGESCADGDELDGLDTFERGLSRALRSFEKGERAQQCRLAGAALLDLERLRVLLAVADWLYFRGLAVPNAPISVGSLLRRFSVVITFVLGARFFRETNLRRKALALSAIVLGVIFLCL